MTDTLVLSSAYEPMDRVGWQRAMSLWFTGRVEVVEEYTDRVCKTPSTEFPVPAVVRFLNALRRRRKSVRFNRDNVFIRDRGLCQYCGQAVSKTDSTYDHVIPRAQGGKTVWKNVVIACRACNQRKKDRTPEQAGMALLSVPARPRYLYGGSDEVLQFQSTMPEIWKPYLGW